MTILVNQVGYEPGTQSRAVIQGSDGETLPAKVSLRNADGELLDEYSSGPDVIVPGWKNRVFRIVDFQAGEGGPYVLEAEAAGKRAFSSPFCVESLAEPSALVSDLVSGFTAARSAGCSDDADKAVPFFGDRQGTVDVHGGWYDASGDTSKYLSHLSYANYMNPQQTPLVVWSLLDSRDRLSSGPFPLEDRLELRMREEASWGADFLMRMLDSEGYFYITVFDVWSKELDARKICAYETQNGILSEAYQAAYRQGGGMAIAALARASQLPEGGAGGHSKSEYLEAALKGWRHLEEHSSEYLDDGVENIIDDFCALLAASELLGAGVEECRDAAGRRAESLTKRWGADGPWFRADAAGEWSWFHASDEALPIISLMRAVETGALVGDAAEQAMTTVYAAVEAEVARADAQVNPFLHPLHFVRMPGREDKSQFFYPHDNPSGYWWQGENARLASWAAASRRFLNTDYPLSDGLAIKRFADAQSSWVLGLNPFDACMLQGKGRNNPPYEWDHFNLPGGVANGITSGFGDEDDIAFMPAEAMANGDHSWRWGEQWIPHAAWLLLAVSWAG